MSEVSSFFFFFFSFFFFVFVESYERYLDRGRMGRAAAMATATAMWDP